MENKKIKIELTLDELDIIINDIWYWDYEYDLSENEIKLAKKLEQIKSDFLKEENNGN